jgi:MFS family permease
VSTDPHNPTVTQPEESALRVPQFRLYWCARLLGSIAEQMQAVAVGWQVYNMSGRALDLGLVGLSLFFPMLVLALVTGHVVDHFNRRLVLVVATLLDAVCVTALCFLSFTGNHDVHWIFLVLVFTGTARAFEFPASLALMPNLVEVKLYQSAAAWSSISWQTAAITGPPLGGFLYILGPVVTYGTCAVLLLCSALLLLLVKVRHTARGRGALTWAATLAGFNFIRNQKIVLGAISLDLFAVLLGGATALLPVYARDILAVGPSGLGILRSAPALGALLSATLMVHYPIRKDIGRALLAWIAVFGTATIAFGLSTNLILSLAMLALLGGADMVSVIIRRVLIQVATPDDMRGRVSSIEGVFIGASNELGEFRAGVMAALFGTVTAVVIGGVGTVLVVALWTKWFPQLREVDSMESITVD